MTDAQAHALVALVVEACAEKPHKLTDPLVLAERLEILDQPLLVAQLMKELERAIRTLATDEGLIEKVKQAVEQA